ncbi:MAG: YlxR family protein [Nocardioidaceae bacterium]|nr:MAG: YlxR family protein [Nocardioidaceae bacterium]
MFAARCNRRGDQQPGSQGPVRTCVGCREQAPQQELLRVVAGNGILIPDPQRREPGRGCSVHPNPACLELALRRRAFTRALKVSGEYDASRVREAIGEARPDGQERWSSSS